MIEDRGSGGAEGRSGTERCVCVCFRMGMDRVAMWGGGGREYRVNGRCDGVVGQGWGS
jgi:hypothetical protein